MMVKQVARWGSPTACRRAIPAHILILMFLISASCGYSFRRSPNISVINSFVSMYELSSFVFCAAAFSSAAFLNRSYSCRRRTSSARGSSSSSSSLNPNLSSRALIRCFHTYHTMVCDRSVNSIYFCVVTNTFIIFFLVLSHSSRHSHACAHSLCHSVDLVKYEIY